MISNNSAVTQQPHEPSAISSVPLQKPKESLEAKSEEKQVVSPKRNRGDVKLDTSRASTLLAR